MTGANAWALNGVAKYLTPDVLNLPEEQEKKAKLKAFYSQLLKGLEVHQNDDGLFSAGWDFYILQNIGEDEDNIKDKTAGDAEVIYFFLAALATQLNFGSSEKLTDQIKKLENIFLFQQGQKLEDIFKDSSDFESMLRDVNNSASPNIQKVRMSLSSEKLKGRSYNMILGIAGYPHETSYKDTVAEMLFNLIPPGKRHNLNPVDELSRPAYDRVDNDQRKRVKAKNVVTEHNLDMLAVLNFAIENAFKLDLDDHRQELLGRRCHVRDAIFTKLYDPVKKWFITGRGPDDSPSRHTAIDNASWLALSAKLKSQDSNGIWPENAIAWPMDFYTLLRTLHRTLNSKIPITLERIILSLTLRIPILRELPLAGKKMSTISKPPPA